MTIFNIKQIKTLRQEGKTVKENILKVINIKENNNYNLISDSRIYNIWSCLKQRCLNPKNKNYNLYGGRGITVCDNWVSSFDTFYIDMIETYKYNLTIDRIDTNKGYSKENCKWIPANEQQKNRRPFSEWNSKYNNYL